MYHRNVKSECILCKFCVLDSKVFCEICTKFHLKLLSDSSYQSLNIKNKYFAVCWKYHVYCLYDCVKTSLSDCCTLYWKQQNIYPSYLKIDNSAVRQYFQMKFCAYITEYFRIKHTKFTQDAFRFHISVVHCVGLTFFPDTVYTCLLYTSPSPRD